LEIALANEGNYHLEGQHNHMKISRQFLAQITFNTTTLLPILHSASHFALKATKKEYRAQKRKIYSMLSNRKENNIDKYGMGTFQIT